MCQAVIDTRVVCGWAFSPHHIIKFHLQHQRAPCLIDGLVLSLTDPQLMIYYDPATVAQQRLTYKILA